MATTPTQISVEEYLHTVYKPDFDYVDGELEEREVGEYDHSTWRAILLMFFGARQMEWGIKARPQLRVMSAHRRYHIPDVCMLSREAPIEQIVKYPRWQSLRFSRRTIA